MTDVALNVLKENIRKMQIMLNTGSRRSQEESVRRLSRPLRRGSMSSGSFSSEVKPRFWKYATAKSIEDLIHALRRKKRGRRVYKMEDYFFFKDRGFLVPNNQRKSLATESALYGADEPDDLNLYIGPNSILEPSLTSNKSSTSTDIEVIKPYVNRDVLRIMSYGTVSDRSSTRSIPTSESLINFNEKEKSSLIKQCMDNASLIFKKIDEAIEENKKLAEKKIRSIAEKRDLFNQKRKFKNKSFSPLEALSKIEEISNVIDLKKSHRTDLILADKYLPGHQVSEQQKEFVKALQKKLEKLQQSYQHWTKWQEVDSVERLSLPKRRMRKVVNS